MGQGNEWQSTVVQVIRTKPIEKVVPGEERE
jgi:hypothetical protein